MRYFELLNLRREPFSNSPDPELFYDTKQHRDCLRSLEISIRLRRGLSVVTGHVGTGKTTLCRQLIRVLESRHKVFTTLILDPFFSDPGEFLLHLNRLFGIPEQKTAGASHWQLRENIKDMLFRRAVEEDTLMVLIVDEGQKMSPDCLELLRELLNFETNEHKLLQIVIFGQLELENVLAAQANLADRVSLKYRLSPLDFEDTRELILARITMCAKDRAPEGLFTFWAFLAVYLATDGFPRQIVQLCHQALLATIIKEKPRVTWGVVRGCMRWRNLGLPRRRRWPVLAAGVALALALVPWGLAAGLGVDPWQIVSERFRQIDFSWRPPLSAPKPAMEAKPTTSFTSDSSGAPPAADAPATPGLPPAAGAGAAPGASGPAGAAQAPAGQGAAASSGGPGAVGAPAAPGAAVAPGAGGVPGAGGAPGAGGGPGAAVARGTTIAPGAAGAAGAPGGLGAASPSGGPGAPAQEPGQPPAAPHQQAQASQEQPAGANLPATPRFLGVTVSEDNGKAAVDILTDRAPLRVETSVKHGPSRLVIDLAGLWERRGDKEYVSQDPRVDKVRTAVFADKLRVVIYLKNQDARPAEPQALKTGQGLRILVD